MKMKLLRANGFVLRFDMPYKWHLDHSHRINEKLIAPAQIQSIG
jgi:hypothetical protein